MSRYEIIADLSIPLRFNGTQPNAFNVEAATAIAIGDTRKGASVNFEQYTFIPHCNGTHTECVGHITDKRISVRDCLQDVILTAALISVEPTSYDGDKQIELDSLQSVSVIQGAEALIVRTLPNEEAKLSRIYGEGDMPAYFSMDAMRYIVECGFKHLLVDLPSIDRMYDEGKLENHRIFWNVEPGSRSVSVDTRMQSTVTELVYVSSEIEDGNYLLNIQIAPFEADASPSRPVLLRNADVLVRD